MNPINETKVESLIHQIEQAGVVVVDDSPILHSVDVNSLVTGEGDNEILSISWEDAEGFEFIVKFTEEGLSNANFKDNQIMLLDHEGDNSTIKLFELSNSPIVKNW